MDCTTVTEKREQHSANNLLAYKLFLHKEIIAAGGREGNVGDR